MTVRRKGGKEDRERERERKYTYMSVYRHTWQKRVELLPTNINCILSAQLTGYKCIMGWLAV